jgi:hypothetical protein
LQGLNQDVLRKILPRFGAAAAKRPSTFAEFRDQAHEFGLELPLWKRRASDSSLARRQTRSVHVGAPKIVVFKMKVIRPFVIDAHQPWGDSAASKGFLTPN